MAVAPYEIEVECARGLEEVVMEEISRCCGRSVSGEQPPVESATGAIRLIFSGRLEKLTNLNTAIAVYLVLPFAIPRPRALLGDQHFRRLLGGIQVVFDLSGREVYDTLFISAAGRDSGVLQRLKDLLGEKTGLRVGIREGDLLIRLRRSISNPRGWEALIRLTPRPLATRAWRVCNYEGALNASVAQAMVQLTHPRPEDFYLNLACGSGTLLIERLIRGEAHRVIGCDISQEALRCAQNNLDAASLRAEVRLLAADGCALPLGGGRVDVISADLPFGGLVGSHAENLELYPRILKECARVACQDARMVLITHEITLIRALLADSTEWIVQQEIQISLSGLHPCILLLARVSD
jgi:23S rRNA G2445 N2-methylase RlmL